MMKLRGKKKVNQKRRKKLESTELIDQTRSPSQGLE